MKGQLNAAAEALAYVRGQPVASDYIKDELAEIVANHEYEMQVVPQTSYIGSWIACFHGSLRKGNSNLRRIILGAGLQMMQQLTGINFIFYFGTTFFQQLGTIKEPFFISLVTTLVNVVSTPISFWSIEHFGRRFLLIWGAIGMVVMQYIVAVVGVTAGRPDQPENDAAVKTMIAFICLYIFFFATTWGPTAWVIVGERFPLPIRSRGVGIATASNWFWNCIMAVITPYMVGKEPGSADLGPKVFFIWGSLCILSLAFAYFLVPEMKGLTLEQIDQMMEETSPRNSAGWKATTTFVAEMARRGVDEDSKRGIDMMPAGAGGGPTGITTTVTGGPHDPSVYGGGYGYPDQQQQQYQQYPQQYPIEYQQQQQQQQQHQGMGMGVGGGYGMEHDGGYDMRGAYGNYNQH